MKSSARLFSIEEANALLPELDTRLSRLRTKKEMHERLHDEVLMHELLAQAEGRAGIHEDSSTLESALHAVEAILSDFEKEFQEIRRLGCILRSIDRGWIDFPSSRGTEFVYLCWQRGETSVRFYHSAGDGTTERRPL